MSNLASFVKENLSILKAYQDQFTPKQLKVELSCLKNCFGNSVQEISKNIISDKNLMNFFLEIQNWDSQLNDQIYDCQAV